MHNTVKRTCNMTNQERNIIMLENIIAALQLTAMIASGLFFMFGLPWLFAIGCVVMGHGPEVCGL